MVAIELQQQNVSKIFPGDDWDLEYLRMATYQNLGVGVDLGVNWGALVAVG